MTSNGCALSVLTTRRVCVAAVTAFALHAGVGSVARASEPERAGALLVGVALAQGSFDRLSVSDIRPQSRREWGGRVGLDYQLSERWAATVTGYVGGAWFDFNGFAVSGKIVDASWSARAGVDRVISVGGGSTLSIGVGFEYGEARSWLDNLTISQAGPHNYTTGGSTRVAIVSPRLARFQIYGELLQSFYRAHARDGTSWNKYNWLGGSLTGGVGVRFALARGHSRR